MHSKYYLCKYGLAPVIISISCLSLHFPNLFQLTDIWAILDFDRHLDLNCTFPYQLFLVHGSSSSCFGYLYRVFILTHAISWLSKKLTKWLKISCLWPFMGMKSCYLGYCLVIIANWGKKLCINEAFFPLSWKELTVISIRLTPITLPLWLSRFCS